MKGLNYKIGMTVEGKVTGIQPYGVFISLDDDTQGLIHISEVRNGYTEHLGNYIHVGETIKAKIIDIDEYTKKISLSIRAIENRYTYPTKKHRHYFTNRQKKIGFATLEKELPIWIDEAMKDKKCKH